MSTRRPNILFAIADDASHFGCYGHSFVQTPTVDALAADGVRFTQAFTTNPKCAPSRASILTGRHTWQLDEACNHMSLFPSKFDVFPDLLEASGYRVGFTGKGWAPGSWEDAGRNRNPAGPEYNARTLVPPDQSLICDTDYCANFEDFLSERDEREPFCFWYGGHEPHRHYAEGEGIRGGKRLEDITSVPPYWPDEEVIRRDMIDYAYEIEWFDSQLAKFIDHLRSIGELENTVIVVTSDNGAPFPRVKGQMYDDDFRLPLVVRWGDGCPGARVVDDLVSFTDFAPTFMDLAGVPVDKEAVAGRSLVPILSSEDEGVTDASRSSIVMGRERHDQGREKDLGYPVRCIRTHEMLYVRNFAPDRWPAGNPETGYTNCDGSPTKRRVLELKEIGETKWHDLAFGKRPAEELYDVRRDGYCMENLADCPEYAEVKARLSLELERILRETGDPRIEGKGDVFETYPYCGIAKHSWESLMDGTWEPQGY